MTQLKRQMQEDLTAAMKSRDELRTATLRMVLTAVATEEVAGKQSRELADDEIRTILRREAKRRIEAAEAFDRAGRNELAARELAEREVVLGYLPAELSDDELAAMVDSAVSEAGSSPPGPADMGAVMRLVTPAVAGRADGARVAAAVRRRLGN